MRPSRIPDAPAPALDFASLADAVAAPSGDPARRLAEWARDYLMQPHPDLGRAGHVCPFTARAAQLGTIKIAVSTMDGGDHAALMAAMGAALRTFESIACKRSMRQFRTVIVGFPHCADAAGLAALKRVQRAMRHHSILGAKMVGLFEPNSADRGLLNPAFRPLRSPIPVLAIRMLVEADAPFVIRNPLLAPIYVLKFPLAGTRRLVALRLAPPVSSR